MPLNMDDWIRAALSVIAEGGVAAVAVEPLATRLGTTKGSFYWHFRSREQLVSEALATWEREDTDELIVEFERMADPIERLRATFALIIDDEDYSSSADVALLAAGTDPLAAPFVARVQRKRLGYLERCFRDLGLPPTHSRHRARLAYSAYLGWFQQRAGEGVATARERAAYRRTVITLLTTPLPKI